ncbi:MAG: tetratricopeptide repeat protein [bacterium]|nr:tetratricopeptide repeat protein [bacterium]
MARTAFAILSATLVAVLTVAAGSPPNLGEALAAQRQLVSDQPYDAAAHNDLGNLLVLDGDHEEATEAYRKAIELDAESALPRFNLGVLLQQNGLRRQAQAEFESLLELDPGHARAHYQLGMLYESRGRRSPAVKHYAQAFALDPELTFPEINPHIIDNELATSALLESKHYAESPSADMPRLYGEPERIVGLMLDPEDSAEPGQEDMVEPGSEARSVERAARRELEEDDPEEGELEDLEDEEGLEDDEEAEADEADRRSLTKDDLEVGSSVGQSQGAGPVGSASRRGPAIGVGGGRSGSANTGRERPRPSLRPRGGTSGSGTTSSGTTPSGRRPRYRPAAPASTGRLELRLLPAEPIERVTR